MCLQFKELRHKSWIVPNKKELEVPGVYIWGFLFDCHIDPLNNSKIAIGAPTVCDDEFLDSPNFKEKVFIPYYTGKSDKDIYSRLSSHICFKSHPADKYIRINLSYMNRFFLNENLINPIRPPKDYQKDRQMALTAMQISYTNITDVMNKFYLLNQVGKNFSICHYLQMNLPIEDNLYTLSVKYNNFWFTYLPIEKPKDDTSTDKKYFEQWESYIFWSLKGVTLSQVEKYQDVEKLDPKTYSFCDNNLINQGISIFKKNLEDVIQISRSFEGYLV